MGNLSSQSLKFIDSHCHLDFAEFETNLESILNKTFQSGVTQCVIPGVSAFQSRSLLNWSKAFTSIGCKLHVAAGLHPYFLTKHTDLAIESLTELLHTNNRDYVAVGECGLDRTIENLEKQITLLEIQIQLANQYRKPIIIHHRKSHDLIMASFKTTPPEYGGVIHAFTGSLQQAHQYIDKGFKLGVGGSITYPRAQKTRNTILKLPAHSLLLETDSPSMPLFGQQGQPNLPTNIPIIFDTLCMLRNVKDKHPFADCLYKNGCQLFGF